MLKARNLHLLGPPLKFSIHLSTINFNTLQQLYQKSIDVSKGGLTLSGSSSDFITLSMADPGKVTLTHNIVKETENCLPTYFFLFIRDFFKEFFFYIKLFVEWEGLGTGLTKK